MEQTKARWFCKKCEKWHKGYPPLNCQIWQREGDNRDLRPCRRCGNPCYGSNCRKCFTSFKTAGQVTRWKKKI